MTTGFSDPTLGTLVILYGAYYLVGLAIGAIAWLGTGLAGLDRDRVTLGLAVVLLAVGAAKQGWEEYVWELASGGFVAIDWILLLAPIAVGIATIPVIDRLATRVRETAVG